MGFNFGNAARGAMFGGVTGGALAGFGALKRSGDQNFGFPGDKPEDQASAFRPSFKGFDVGAWRQEQQGLLSSDQAQAREASQRRSASEGGQVMNRLASSGGLSSGARERATQTAARGGRVAGQRQGMLEQQQSAALGAQAGEFGRKEIERRGAFDMQQYKIEADRQAQREQVWAAQQAAAEQQQAAATSGGLFGGGGMLGTGFKF